MIDENGDGRPESRAEFASGGAKTFEDQDTNLDGHYDVRIFFENGRRVRIESDTDHDGVKDRDAFF